MRKEILKGGGGLDIHLRPRGRETFFGETDGAHESENGPKNAQPRTIGGHPMSLSRALGCRYPDVVGPRCGLTEVERSGSRNRAS